jgi:hypothetical protein
MVATGRWETRQMIAASVDFYPEIPFAASPGPVGRASEELLRQA